MTSKNQKVKRFIYTDVFFLGFTLIAAQIILIREFLLLFNGNELVIGIVFSIWMILTASGSWLGRFFNGKSDYPALLRGLLILLTIYPIFAVFSIEYFRNDIFEYGRMASFYEIIGYTFIILLPFCFSGGYLFTALNIMAGKGRGRLQNCYAIESFGSLCGGIIVSLYFIYMLGVDNFRSLTYLVLINFVYFGITDFRRGKQISSFGALAVAIGVMILIYNVEPGKIAKEKFFDGQELLLTEETIFGNLSVTRTGNQLNYYENGVILFSDGNIVQKEEDIHYALLQKPGAKNILLVGGGYSGTINEILKYSAVEEITYVENNPEIINLYENSTKTFGGITIRTYAIDPIVYINKTTKKFDIIFVNLPSPSNAQLNRYYTQEFYSKVHQITNSGGILSTRLASSANYLSDEELKLQASIYNSLNQVFKYVLVVQGDKNYYLSSDSILTVNYIDQFSKTGIETDFVNSNYLNDDLIRFRSDKIIESYQEHHTINYDFKPTVYLYYIQHWISYYGNNYWIIPVISFMIILIFAIFSRPFSTVMFTSGFTGAGTEIVLLIVFQVLVGYVYLLLGVVITIFMAGLMTGAFLSRKIAVTRSHRLTIITQLISGIFLFVIAVSLTYIKDIQSGNYLQFILCLFMLIVSCLVGYQYGLSVSRKSDDSGKTVSSIYAADLVGSAIGSLLTAILLIPVLGIYVTLYYLSGFHFLTLLIYLIKHKIKYL